MDSRDTSEASEMPPQFPSTVPAYALRSRSLPVNIATNSRRQSTLAAIVLRKKSDFDIILDGESELVHSYSTYDEIQGRVEMKFEKDTNIDDVVVTFEGQTATYVEKIATTAPTHGRTTGRHTFLRLQQPFDQELLPENGVAKAGVNYTFPFQFVVPDRLLPYVCSHRVDSVEVREAHLRLPPSMGDPNPSGNGNMLVDDMSPDMAKVTYAINATAIRKNNSGKIVTVAGKTERIRVIPAREEDPPITVGEQSTDYVLRKEKPVKKGLFKVGKIGCLTAETTQPRSLRTRHPRNSSDELVTTMTTVNLRFDPQTPNDQPPQLGSIVSKLRVCTFFGAAPYKSLPELRQRDNWSTVYGLYPESIELSSRCLSTVSWTRHDPLSRTMSDSTDISRRPSTFSSISMSSIPEPSGAYHTGSPFYTANVIVPISLPNQHNTNKPKTFVPTFHSCIISRVYVLELNVSYHTPGTNVSSPHITLKSPIQVSAEGGHPPSPTTESEAIISAEIEHQFGLYEARQLEDAMGLQIPDYEEVVSPPPQIGGGTRHASLASGAPPEYRATGPSHHRSQGPQTQSVSIAA